MKRQRRLVSWWQSRTSAVQDAILAAVVTGLAYVPPFSGAGVILGGLPQNRLDALGALLVLAQSLPLAARRRYPLLCLVAVTAAFGVHQALGYPPTVAGVGLYIALYSAGAHQARFRHSTAVAFAAAYTVLSIVLSELGSPERPFGFATFFLVLLACWAAGVWIRGRRADEAQRRRHDAEAAIARERTRIARELHDVVTHHVTAMVVQADAAQYLLDQPDRVAAGLDAVGGTGRRALTELRHLLDVLDAPHDTAAAGRAPAVGLLDDLVEETRRAGQPVELTQEGEREAMSSGVGLAVYRVVQEGLTNAVKHARSHPTTVHVHYGADVVDVEVSTAGPVVATTVHGRGLNGLRERVGLLGGEFHADGRPGGGFTVAARVPSREAA